MKIGILTFDNLFQFFCILCAKFHENWTKL